jgi:hypothetical protein
MSFQKFFPEVFKLLIDIRYLRRSYFLWTNTVAPAHGCLAVAQCSVETFTIAASCVQVVFSDYQSCLPKPRTVKCRPLQSAWLRPHTHYWLLSLAAAAQVQIPLGITRIGLQPRLPYSGNRCRNLYCNFAQFYQYRTECHDTKLVTEMDVCSAVSTVSHRWLHCGSIMCGEVLTNAVIHVRIRL